MPETFRNNPYAQNIEVGPRMSLKERVVENMKNRVREPIKGLFGNIIRDNYRATKKALKEIVDPWQEKDVDVEEMDVPRAMWHYSKNIFDRTVGGAFNSFSQFFGSGLGELISLKPQDVAARTIVGAMASPVFFKEAAKDTWKLFTKPVKSAVKAATGFAEDVFDNALLGTTRILVGFLTGKRADSPLYEVQPTAPRMQTPWTRLSHTKEDLSNREAHRQRDMATVGHRTDFETEVYNKAYAPPHGNPWAIPNKRVEVNASAPNLYEVDSTVRMAA